MWIKNTDQQQIQNHYYNLLQLVNSLCFCLVKMFRYLSKNFIIISILLISPAFYLVIANLVQDVEDLFPVLKASTFSAPRSWNFYPFYCILCIFPLLRFQIGAKLEILQNCSWKFLSPQISIFLAFFSNPASQTIFSLLYQHIDKFSSSKSPSSSISES